MRKIYAFIFAISVTTFASSCTKEITVQPQTVLPKALVADKSDLGYGD